MLHRCVARDNMRKVKQNWALREVALIIALVASSLCLASTGTGASESRGASFCRAKSFLAHVAQGGYLMPIHQWKTVVEEKATLNEVENDLVTATAIGSTSTRT
jgi:hypothetical protein